MKCERRKTWAGEKNGERRGDVFGFCDTYGRALGGLDYVQKTPTRMLGGPQWRLGLTDCGSL